MADPAPGAISRGDITGLILAGGRGQRMQGRDKGLQLHAGRRLVDHALQRLTPQVGQIAISANRHLDDYRALGCPVWPDSIPGFAGPLAGWLTALQLCSTPYLVSAACDTPAFPQDLVLRLAASLADAAADIAVAATPSRSQPVFSLMRTRLAADLGSYLAGGDRQVMRWISRQRFVEVRFDDETAFHNLNTLDDL